MFARGNVTVTTTKQKLLKLLEDRGMFPDQAEATLEQAIPVIESLVPDYCITWDRPAYEYPEVMYSIWLVTLKAEALKWIDANIPQAWFRPMFINESTST